eukprot:2229505-Prorocentrum_lima.AAC.1
MRCRALLETKGHCEDAWVELRVAGAFKEAMAALEQWAQAHKRALKLNTELPGSLGIIVVATWGMMVKLLVGSCDLEYRVQAYLHR